MRHLVLLLSLIFAGAAPSLALAQQDAVAAAEGATQQPLDAGQLEQLVAPIALYPDPLLAEVLMASTYPLEIVQADRFAKANKDLKGEKLDQALTTQDWDDSIKALVATPSVLAMMSEQLDWTEKLGDAVLAQQADVMDAIQRLRVKAHDNGKLETTEQQTVKVVAQDSGSQEAGNTSGEKQVIVIEPAKPDTVYVPYYDPAVVYGTWSYPAYEPYYFPPPVGWGLGGAIARGIAWGAGFAIADAIWDGFHDDFDWHHGDIRVNRNVNVNNINRGDINVSNWQHNPKHRRGVNYNSETVKSKFAKAGGRPDGKLDFRGHDGKPIIKPGGGDRPHIGDGGLRPGGGDRPQIGDGGLRPGGGDRPHIDNLPKRPGDKKPDIGKIKEGLQDKRPGAQAALQDRNIGKGKPDLAKAKAKAKARPAGGNAFDTRDGAKAKDFAKRGHASLGDRGAKQFAKPPAMAKPKGAAVRKGSGRPAHVGGGRPGGGHARRGGGGRRR